MKINRFFPQQDEGYCEKVCAVNFAGGLPVDLLGRSRGGGGVEGAW